MHTLVQIKSILNDVDTSNCKAMISMIKATCLFFFNMCNFLVINLFYINISVAYRCRFSYWPLSKRFLD